MDSSKLIVYQVLPRLFGNVTKTNKKNGTIEDNGSGKFNSFTPSVLRKLKQLGVTHMWYTGVVRHASKTDYSSFGIPKQHPAVVKGNAGSPYAIADYYDVDPDLAENVSSRMEEFTALVERTHKSGMKVIIDFVPNHVAREYHSVTKPSGVKDLGEDDRTDYHFFQNNNYYYCWGEAFKPQFSVKNYEEKPAKATGNDHFGAHPGTDDWYETVKLNYGVDYCDAGGRSNHFEPIPDTWHKMLHILRYWAEKNIDGFRCDMAEMVPVEFWKWVIPQIRQEHPSILFIGEVYNPSQYRSFVHAGFNALYDKVGMYDTLFDVIHSGSWTHNITRQWQQQDDILPHMLYFLENHDELRIANPFFADQPERALPALMVSAWLHTGPVMIYFGQEFGEQGMDQEGFSGLSGRTTIFDYWHIDKVYRGYFDRRKLTQEEKQLEEKYKTILNIARREKAVSQGAMFDLMYVNTHLQQHQFVFLRKHENEVMLVVVNFSGQEARVHVNIPDHAFQYLQLPRGTFQATDLLTGEVQSLNLTPDEPLAITIPANGGVALKFQTV